jgi:outer membrane biosynthesis protein TonB
VGVAFNAAWTGCGGAGAASTETEPRTSDTNDYPRKVQDKIQRLLTYPAPRAGQLRAEFAISVMASGWPVRVDLVQSSGDAEFDAKARGAILAASPLHDAQEVHFEGLRNFRVTLRALSTERSKPGATTTFP